ncbi:hypothetical protein SANTM175S_06024 [Streptomyces antimycoticus]
MARQAAGTRRLAAHRHRARHSHRVHAEARFYRQVVAEVTGATVVLISHRLSTVRQADRIVLLEAGQVTEQGTHRELLDDGGEYARLFRIQAARFTDTGPRTGEKEAAR